MSLSIWNLSEILNKWMEQMIMFSDIYYFLFPTLLGIKKRLYDLYIDLTGIWRSLLHFFDRFSTILLHLG